MWARVVEIMLGCWLAVSPFIFQHADGETMLWVVDLSSATLVIAFGLLSYWPPMRHIHLLTSLVGLALCGFGYFWESSPVQPALQNNLVIGLLLVMFGIIPNWASRSSPAWEAFEEQQTSRSSGA